MQYFINSYTDFKNLLPLHIPTIQMYILIYGEKNVFDLFLPKKERIKFI